MSEIAKALAEVQADLPQVTKGETAKVQTKDGGSYSYTYADLADISAVVLPLLAKHGMAFVASPTVNDAGAFVLSYAVLHSSGEKHGPYEYPLPTQGGMQAQGSAITYARRYCLCAVVGVAPEDDDGQAAQQASQRPSEPKEQPAEKPAKGGKACPACGDDLTGAALAKDGQGRYVHKDGCAQEVGRD